MPLLILNGLEIDKTVQTSQTGLNQFLLVIGGSTLQRDWMLLRVELDFVATILRQDIDHLHRVEPRTLQHEPPIFRVHLARGVEPAKSVV